MMLSFELQENFRALLVTANQRILRGFHLFVLSFGNFQGILIKMLVFHEDAEFRTTPQSCRKNGQERQFGIESKWKTS